MQAATPVPLTFTLPLRDPAGLDRFLARVADPADALYGHFLTPAEFAARFGPTQASYDAVAAWAQSQGLHITGRHSNRLLLDAAGPASAAEAAFRVHFYQYRAADGRLFRAPDADPSVPASLTGHVSGVVGLSTGSVRRPYKRRRPGTVHAEVTGGTGPLGGLAPVDIKTAYNLRGTSLTGSGQTLAVFELDGYRTSDIRVYESKFGLPTMPLQNILVGGASGTAGTNIDEVTLDIELQNALAPGAAKMLVYETTNTDSGVLGGYSRIAEDNLAKQISTSWGLDEPESTTSFMQSENTIFRQMAAQGQTMYAAAGDNGAYDSGQVSDGTTVDDPASQPYVCGVGGTSLSTRTVGGAYLSETTWNAGSATDGASGGGFSSLWAIPTWQQGAVTSSVGGSQTRRNVPDVSLNADPNTGYAIYVSGAWTVYGGCSAAAPLWAGFTALVNQQRAALGMAPLGQASPALYPLLKTAAYTSDFHDIADGSTNLFYPAVTGYDDATGLGTFNGANLLASLSTPAASTPTHSWTATAIASGPDGKTRVLWNKTDGSATVWTLNADGSAASYSPVFGPLPSWTAAALSVGPDNSTRLLWTNTSGSVTLWTLPPGSSTPSYGPVYGPYAGWTAVSIATAPDGGTRLLWDNTNGTMTVWTMPVSGPVSYGPVYGPIAGWTAKAVATGPDSGAHVLWNNANGAMTVWNCPANGSAPVYSPVFGPYAGWTAGALSVDANNAAHVLWNNSDGRMTLWTVSANGTASYGSVFGPYAGWSAAGVTVTPDGNSHVLWDNAGGQMTPWTLDTNSNFVGTFPTYGPY